jgi:hypothetical protein
MIQPDQPLLGQRLQITPYGGLCDLKCAGEFIVLDITAFPDQLNNLGLSFCTQHKIYLK